MIVKLSETKHKGVPQEGKLSPLKKNKENSRIRMLDQKIMDTIFKALREYYN